MGLATCIVETCLSVFFIWQTFMIASISTQSIYIADNVTAEKGQDVQLVCDLGLGNWTSAVWVYKTNTSDIGGSIYLTGCSKKSNVCMKLFDHRYKVEMDKFDVYFNISNLNRSEDEMFWTCAHSHTRAQMFLTVYTTPTASVLSSSFEGFHSLSEGSMSITCKTDKCAYKDPVFVWYLVYENGTWQRFDIGKTTSWDSDILCDDSEMLYHSQLSIKENSTFPDNSDITVQFACAISFTTLPEELVSPTSGNVTFAVQIETVELFDGDQVTTNDSTIAVTHNEQYSVTCKPGPSRPQPIFLLYIGSQIIQESKNGTFAFTADKRHHGDKIYCKAYNLQGKENSVVSNKPRLYVNIPVSKVLIRGGNDQLENCSFINVSEGMFKTLLCTHDENRPTPTIVWYVDGKVRQNHTSSIFTFIPEMEDHNKHVHCVANNLPRYEPVESAKPTLHVTGRPLQPLTFLFTGLRGQNATFYWIAGYDGGYKQSFVLQYRKIENNDWISHTQYEKTIYPDAEASITAYATQIINPKPGVYNTRLIGRNVRGESNPLDIMGSTIEIVYPESEKESELSQLPTPIVITATVMGCVILILVGIIVYLLIVLKRSRLRSTATTDIKLEDITGTVTESPNAVYDELKRTEQVTGSTYDKLERSESRMYENTTMTDG